MRDASAICCGEYVRRISASRVERTDILPTVFVTEFSNSWSDRGLLRLSMTITDADCRVPLPVNSHHEREEGANFKWTSLLRLFVRLCRSRKHERVLVEKKFF